MDLKIAILSEDEPGQEIVYQAKKVLYTIGVVFEHSFVFEDAIVGFDAFKITGNSLPKETLNLCLNTDAIIFGTNRLKNNFNLEEKENLNEGLHKLKNELQLFADALCVKSYSVYIEESSLKNELIQEIDFTIFRTLVTTCIEKNKVENDILLFEEDKNLEEKLLKLTHLAFKKAEKRRKRITLVVKKESHTTINLLENIVNKLSTKYPTIKLELLSIEEAIKQIILNPAQFDIILTDKLNGVILTETSKVIKGTKSILASVSFGNKNAFFEPIYNVNPKTKDAINPFASIVSVAMILEYFGLQTEANKIHEAIQKALELGIVTTDLNFDSKFNCNDIGNFISNYISNKDDFSYFNIDNVKIGQSTIV